MNRTAIEWTDYTWNPVTGCLHGCPYCYARRLAEGRLRGRFGYENGFRPTFHRDRLDQPSRLKRAAKIFTVSMGDMFGKWVDWNWIHQVLHVVRHNPRHTFQVLTKAPDVAEQYFDFNEPPANLWLGVSAEGSEESSHRLVTLGVLNGGVRKFASFEPLLHDATAEVPALGSYLRGMEWLIIGAQTGPRARQPDPAWVIKLIAAARKAGVAVFVKENVEVLSNKPQEFPEGMIVRKEATESP